MHPNSVLLTVLLLPLSPLLLSVWLVRDLLLLLGSRQGCRLKEGSDALLTWSSTS
jgi:hypothetical protein